MHTTEKIHEKILDRKVDHSVIQCPLCKGHLSNDKKAYTDYRTGKRIRNRKCRNCGADIYTQQPAEEITGVVAVSDS